MELIINPNPANWVNLAQRPTVDAAQLQETVAAIFEAVKTDGDAAVKAFTLQFDKVDLDTLLVSDQSIQEAIATVPDDLKAAIQLAKSNIEAFHATQKEVPRIVETTPGVTCWRESRAIESVGIYIPGGTAPLFSTVLMLGIPATLAGCREIVLCSPPDAQGHINPVILYTAQLVGITAIYRVGGIQAIAAMTYGTESIAKVNKVFGPGNQYVTAAKQYAQQSGTAIDMPAGPSELLVIADDSAIPAFVASDLLSQLEHGTDSQVVLLCDSERMARETLAELEAQWVVLPRKKIIEHSLKNSKVMVFDDVETCLDFSNLYAPEHLILAVERAAERCAKVVNAGSVFLGNYSCESAGDYASGTNHTLPTNGYARSYSGVSVDSFIKKITFQSVTAQGLKNIGPAIELMAAAEQLEAHKNAVTLRLNHR